MSVTAHQSAAAQFFAIVIDVLLGVLQALVLTLRPMRNALLTLCDTVLGGLNVAADRFVGDWFVALANPLHIGRPRLCRPGASEGGAWQYAKPTMVEDAGPKPARHFGWQRSWAIRCIGDRRPQPRMAEAIELVRSCLALMSASCAGDWALGMTAPGLPQAEPLFVQCRAGQRDCVNRTWMNRRRRAAGLRGTA